jgi:hypothetical protein
MGITITAEQRDYNGFLITRDNKGRVTNFVADNLTESIRLKNIERIGKIENGKFIEGEKINSKKLSSSNKDEIINQIKESNRRREIWLQEQKTVQQV